MGQSYESVITALYDMKMAFEHTKTIQNIPPRRIITPSHKMRHTGAFGSSGTGKTTSRILTIEIRRALGFKVICFDSQEELGFIHLPCPEDHVLHPKLIAQRRTPKGIPTRVLLPLGYSGGIRLIQQSDIPVHWHPFLLDLYDLEAQTKDWDCLVGGLVGIQEQILKTALLRREADWGVLDVYAEVQKTLMRKDYGYPDVTVDDRDSNPIPVLKGIFPKQSITKLNRNLMDLNSSRFLAPRIWRGKHTSFILDWEKEILDRRHVTVLSIGLLPPNIAHTLITYLVRKTFMMAQKRFTPDGRKIPPIAFVVPEATNFFPRRIPEAFKETMPPLREVFLEVFLRGRRHSVVIDMDTAYWGNIDDRIKAQTHYLFAFDDRKETLNEIVNSRNPENKEGLTLSFPLLKEKGACLYFHPSWSRGMYLKDLIPSCWVPREGENFFSVWEELGGEFKPVDPYYEVLNEIHQDLKARVREEFKSFEEEAAASSKPFITGSARTFLSLLSDMVKETERIEFTQAEVVNRFLSAPGSLSKPATYDMIRRLHEAGFLTLDRSARPYRIKVNVEGLKTVKEEV